MINKINGFLDRKITIMTSVILTLCSIVLVLIILAIIIHPFQNYIYVNNNDEWGKSDRCYKYKNELVCEVRIGVKQYYIE